MRSVVGDVRNFHDACSILEAYGPQIPYADRKALRISLINEEVNNELLKAMRDDDLVGIADGMADAIYVIVGAALEYGIPLARVWDAVQAANMAKVDPHTGIVTRREDGKILKPEGWTPPDIEKILREAAE